MVPKSRLDEVLAKQKALQKQVEEMKAAAEKPADAPEEYDFDAKELEYQQLVLDGEPQKPIKFVKKYVRRKKHRLSGKWSKKWAKQSSSR